jgi:YaaC-like Protein
MTFAAMHRLSELAHYTPMKLARHLDCQHNWLRSEFVATACSQFVDEISSEITGQEFMIPGRKAVS